MNENEISKIIVDVAFHLHKTIGPGLLESVYEAIMAKNLAGRGLSMVREKAIPIQYEDLVFDEGFRADLLVNYLVIVEIKSVERAVAIHKRQLLTYLRMSGKRLGILINFGEPLFKDGIFRVVNGLERENVLDTLMVDSMMD